MTVLDSAIADFSTRFADRLRLTEHRQIELYTKKKKLAFEEEEAVSAPLPSLLGVATAFQLLDAFLESNDESLEGKAGWQKYLALPRASATDKMVAEVYRILRILRAVMVHKSGRLEVKDGILEARATVNRTAIAVHITGAGLNLLESFVAYRLNALHLPHGDAYVEAMLAQYFTDIVAEIKRFADEDRILYQYRHRFYFNRHFRYDCDNPKIHLQDGTLSFEVGELYGNPVRYPIDFFVVVDDALHIVPVEALNGLSIPLSDLPRWRIRTRDGLSLPSQFRRRFGRETMTPGLPMW